MTLGGYICVRNGDEGDYCWREAAASLIPVVDELILCDSDSTDGTREAMDRMADSNPKIRVINRPWTNPRGDAKWWTSWLNFAREHLKTDLQITLDADEILSDHPDCHAAIARFKEAGAPLTVNRLNFWKDTSHLIPEGHCCGKWVTRLGPASFWMPSDEGYTPDTRPEILRHAIVEPRIEIFHLGFLRRKDAFWKKAKVVLGAFFDTYDPRLERLEQTGKPLADVQDCEWTNSIVPWSGYMPDSAQRWLSARGHHTQNYVGMTEREAFMRVKVVAPPPDRKDALNVLVVGDYGDIIYGMAIFSAIGRVRLFARDANHICKRIIHRMPGIGPLLLSQHYVTGFTEHRDEEIHWNAGDFRIHYDRASSLAKIHLMHYVGQRQLPVILPSFHRPWLTGIQKNPTGAGRIIINRTDRYPNPYFRWKEIVAHYGSALLFVGARTEHADFCRQFGTVAYQETKDLLEVAQLIAASEMFIGNQSACFAIAEGMKHRRLLEICLYQPDVIVAYPQPNFFISADGALDLPAMGGFKELKTKSAVTNVDYLKNPNTQPRTGWSACGEKDVNYSSLKRKLMRKGMQDKEAHKVIYDALAEREPVYFFNGNTNAELVMYQQALSNAQ